LEGLSLWRDAEGYAVRDRAGRTFRFSRIGARAAHSLLSVTDPQGAQICFHYDAAGRLSHAIDSTGRPVVFVHDDRHRITEIHAPRPDAPTLAQVVVRYVYDGAGELVTAIDALGQPFQYEYRNRLLVREADRRGYSFHFRYDGETTGARCTGTWGEDGLLGVALTYGADRTAVRFADGGEWIYRHDERGLVTDRIDPYGQVVRFAHDEAGRVTEEIRPDGDTTRYEYADSGALIGAVDGAGRRESEAAEDGEDREFVDPNSYSLPESAARWEYGDLLETKGGDGATPPLLLDAPTSVLEAVRRARDSARVDDRGTEEFDRLGRLTRRRNADGTYEAVAYDGEGNIIASKDRDGAITRYTYGSRNLLVAETDPLGLTARYAYSPSLEVTHATDPGGAEHVFEHDLKDRNTAIVTAGERTDSYRYDAADHLVERRDGSDRLLVRYEVGPGGVDLRRILEDGEEHEFEYDAEGRLVAAHTDEFTTSFAYGGDGATTEDLRDGRGIRHTRGADGSLEGTDYLDRFTVGYARDPGDPATLLVTDPTGAVHSFSVVPAGGVLKKLGDGRCELARYAPNGSCMEKLLWRLGTPDALRSRRYTYSACGDLLEASDSAVGTRRYAYDAAHRLIREDRDGEASREYRFDPAGNLLRRPGLDGVKIGVANRLDRANGDRFEHDHRGRVAARIGPGGDWRFHYNALDQLTRIERNGESWEARYDPLGRRISKSWRGLITRYWWDDFRLAAEEREDGAVRVFLYPDLKALVPFMFVDYPADASAPERGRRHYLFTDQIGTPTRVEDEKGREVWSAEIDPFGTAHVAADAGVALSFRFPGHYLDAETGLHYNRFRYYCPELGRYLQPDPLGFEDSLNVYAYSSNPLVVVDLDGLAGYSGNKTKARRRPPRSKTGVKAKAKPRPRPKPRPKKAKKLPPKKLQEAADSIQAVGSRKHPKNHKLTTTTVTQGVENGKVVHTVTNSRGSVSRAQKKKAREVLGPDTRFPRESPGKRPNNGHHAERRGIRGTRGQEGRQQASSGGAGHGGAACGHCATAQRGAGVENVTGTQSGGGRIR
jgi:RHS repeat-associated protein